MFFAHGFGCDQNMWRYVYLAFEDNFKIILIDYVGAGNSIHSCYDTGKYSTLKGYPEDILEICQELNLQEIIFVGHSVGSMIGVLAANKEPDRFAQLIMIGPSPCYINEEANFGGFNREGIEDLMETLERNYLGWSANMAPVIMGNPDRPELSNELENSFCRTNPEIAKRFARVTFLSDNRKDLSCVRIPSLILQCSDDIIAPRVVGEYVNSKIKNSTLHYLDATGHCPNLSAPEETVQAIKNYLASSSK